MQATQAMQAKPGLKVVAVAVVAVAEPWPTTVVAVAVAVVMAVVTLQAWWRMIKVRLWMACWRFCKETMAAVKLQSWSRTMIAIKTLAVRRQERRASLRIEI